ncbi:MAG: glucose 1-dehydrogenase [Dehalococcoidia bacterium]|nr:glucose 1-dehydrogenase [Dehalococcoidia bacterium]
MDMNLAGKTAIVTGGGSNIGRGIVLGLAREGANVVITYRDEKQARKTAGDAESLGGHAFIVKMDVRDRDSVSSMVQQAIGFTGRIDVLVNNVGAGTDGPLLVEKSFDEIDREIETNFRSVIYCSRAVSPYMMEQRYGKIINIGSPSALSGRGGDAIYSSSKAAVIGLTKSLARELGHYNINVNCVCPGWVIPEKREDVGQGSFWYERYREMYTPEDLEKQEKQVRRFPIGRRGNPKDIASMVLFLASDRASYVTGQTICVDGGAVIM